MTERSRRTPKNAATAEHRWHLAMDDFSVEITDLEYAVMRLNQSFSRWQSECMGAVLGVALSGQENALMHVIHMHERPKTIRDLLHMTNRQDVANMQYELRKLIKSGLIEKNGTARTGVYYSTTSEGARVCEDTQRYAAACCSRWPSRPRASSPRLPLPRPASNKWSACTKPPRVRSQRSIGGANSGVLDRSLSNQISH